MKQPTPTQRRILNDLLIGNKMIAHGGIGQGVAKLPDRSVSISTIISMGDWITREKRDTHWEWVITDNGKAAMTG